MVDKITPNYPIVHTHGSLSPRDRVAETMASNPDAKQKLSRFKKMKFVDRRTGDDRRTQYEGRLVYDMRQRKGRRSSDRNHPSIEVDA